MKHIYLFVFFLILSTQVSFGQKVFKITEGELQFINPEGGIYIKKNNTIYQLRLEDIDDYEMLSNGLKYELSNTNFDEIEKIKKDSSTILGSDVVKFDFKKLDTQKFTTKIKDDDNYRLYKYNKNFFSIAILEDSLQKPVSKYLLPYCILDFGNNQKILCFPRGFIVPTKEKLRFLFDSGDLNDAFKQGYQITQFKKLEAVELHSIESGELKLNRHFYQIDTLRNKQLKIKNIYNEAVINKSFDSIAFNGFFIIGYKNNTIDIYNYTFQKLELKNIKGFRFNKSFPSLQIIENNELQTINLTGTTYKKSDLAYQMSYSQFFDPILFRFKITQKEHSFYLETNHIDLLTHNYLGYDRVFKIKDSNEFETVEYLDEDLSAITIDSEMSGFTIKDPIIIYTKLKNGKFNLNSLEYLLAKDPTKEIEDFNNTLPKNLDSISAEMEQMYLIEKNGLFTYYPLIKEIKYKKLNEFKGNFARFELPNGQKGWLALDGKEYFDK